MEPCLETRSKDPGAVVEWLYNVEFLLWLPLVHWNKENNVV